MEVTLQLTKKSLKNFFINTFRHRTKEEYGEIVTRGIVKSEWSGLKYPWLYSRVLFFGLLLFAVLSTLLSLFSNALLLPSVIFLGASCFSLAILTLMFELSPNNSLSLIKLIIIALLGGVGSIVLCDSLYSFIFIENSFLDALYIGVNEEISKIIFALLFIGIFRIKERYDCLLVGASVAIGFTIAEDAGYLFAYTFTSEVTSSFDIPMLIEVFFSRGIIVAHTHVFWTSFICYFFVSRSKYFADVRFYCALVFSMLMHAMWDFSDYVALQYVMQFISAAIYSGWYIYVVIIVRVTALFLNTPQKNENNTEAVFIDQSPSTINFSVVQTTANKLFTICGLIVIVLCFIACSFSQTPTTIKSQFTTPKGVVAYLHNGKDYDTQADREFVLSQSIYASTKIDGKVVNATQRELIDGVYYYYHYDVIFDDLQINYVLNDVELSFNNVEKYKLMSFNIGNVDYFYFNVNEIEFDVIYDESQEAIILIEPYLGEEYDRTPVYIFATAAFAILFAQIVAYTVLTFKQSKKEE